MWGGVTNSGELRAIADVVDKFEIPMVKVTGGQRIDLLGIQKEDLPAVWADLGKAGFILVRPMAEGSAHGEDLRRLELVPLRHPGFDRPRYPHRGIHVGLLDAGKAPGVRGGVRLSEKLRRGDLQGHRCHLRDSGFEIHFAGAAGLDIKGTEVLGLVKTEDEALEHIVALTQMYREQGRYLERIYKWAKRIGLDEIRRQIMGDADKRKAYYDRFVFSQKFAQVDPWSERVSGKDKHEFRPMATVGFHQAAE
ncbi:hypothetical protein [Rhizobium rhizogenes]